MKHLISILNASQVVALLQSVESLVRHPKCVTCCALHLENLWNAVTQAEVMGMFSIGLEPLCKEQSKPIMDHALQCTLWKR